MAEETSQPATGTDDGILSRLATIVDGEAPPEEESTDEVEASGEESQEPEQQAEPEPEKYKVKVNGEEIEVTLDELRAGYQKDSDYRQKTAQVAEERRALQAQRNEQAAKIQQAQQVVDTNMAYLQVELNKFNNVNWAQLAVEDPAQYVAIRAQFDQQLSQFNQLQQQKQYVSQIEAQHQAEVAQETLQSEQQQLLAKLPEWANQETAKAEQAAIAKYLSDFGCDDGEMSVVQNSHRAVLLARKAMLYDQLMAQKPEMKQKLAQAPQRVERPGSGTRPADQRTAQMKQLNRSGRVEDAAVLMKQLLAQS